MDFLVCPIDGARVKVIEARSGRDSRPLVRCPQCSKSFLFTEAGLSMRSKSPSETLRAACPLADR